MTNAPRQLAVMAGLGVTAALVARTIARPANHHPVSPLATYLEEHLAGADAAIRTVERLRRTQANADDRQLFATLFDAFTRDRAVVTDLLREQTGPRPLPKRLAGRAAGTVLKYAAGGHSGELSLLRTLEALSIGVQGKRCMWRALQDLPWLVGPDARTFTQLETSALEQWESIETRRRSVAQQIFTRGS